MLAFVDVAPLGLIILAAVAVAIALWLGRRGLLPQGRRPRPRHIVVRIVCGVLGAVILGAIAVGTWQEVRHCYAAEGPPEGIRLRVPTLAPPELPTPARAGAEVNLEKARLLVSFLVVELGGGEPRPIAAWQLEVRLPQDKGRMLTLGTVVGRYNVASQVMLAALSAHAPGAPHREPSGASVGNPRVYRAKAAPPPTLVADGGTGFMYSGPGPSMSLSAAGLPLGEVWGVEGPTSGPRDKPPLSIVYGPGQGVVFLALAASVAEADPLKEVPLAEFVRLHEAELREAYDGEPLVMASRRWLPRSPERDVPFRGLALASHIGLSSLLLFAAAVLLSQLFARRSLAFAGVLAAVILYVAALDRVALATHLSHLSDAKAPVSARVAACRHAADTFFYRATALRHLRGLAADPEAPASLRDVAREAARVAG